MIIGSHILDGKVVPIDKPLIVLEKEKSDNQTAENHVNDDQSTSNSTEYKMRALIKTKLIFKNRPKPIVLQQHVKKKPRVR